MFRFFCTELLKYVIHFVLSTIEFCYGSDRWSSFLLADFRFSTAPNFYLAGPGGNGWMTAGVVNTAAEKEKPKSDAIGWQRETMQATQSVDYSHNHTEPKQFSFGYFS